MNFEAVTSWFSHADWVFLGALIVLLAAAVGACFRRDSSLSGGDGTKI
jgi:hypothetical protein